MSFPIKVFYAAVCGAMICTAVRLHAGDRESLDRKVQPVIDEVDKLCRQQNVYMIGPIATSLFSER